MEETCDKCEKVACKGHEDTSVIDFDSKVVKKKKKEEIEIVKVKEDAKLRKTDDHDDVKLLDDEDDDEHEHADEHLCPRFGCTTSGTTLSSVPGPRTHKGPAIGSSILGVDAILVFGTNHATAVSRTSTIVSPHPTTNNCDISPVPSTLTTAHTGSVAPVPSKYGDEPESSTPVGVSGASVATLSTSVTVLCGGDDHDDEDDHDDLPEEEYDNQNCAANSPGPQE